MELREDLHILEYNGSSFIYSPLRRALFFADDESVAIAKCYINGIAKDEDKSSQVWNHILRLESIDVTPPHKRKIEKGNNVVVIPTQLCNFGCTYCYAQEAHLYNSVMSKEILKIVLDFVLQSKQKKKNISFIGGGEPLTAWELIKWAVEYLEQNKRSNDILNIGITTNASLFTDEIFKFVKEHNIHVGVSFEILSDIQDSQRPFHGGKGTFEIVNGNIQKLIQYGITYGIRSTITKLNVNRMSEMVEFVAEHYPNIRKLHLEQVTDSSEDDQAFYNAYIDNFYKAKQVGRNYNINVYNSISKSIYQIRDCFCGGEFCVTPTGSLVACHRVSAEHEKAFPLFNYGKINKAIEFDGESEESYLAFASQKREECEKCFARWHCGGICSMERVELSEDQLHAKCDFIKKIITRELYDSLVNKLELKNIEAN